MRPPNEEITVKALQARYQYYFWTLFSLSMCAVFLAYGLLGQTSIASNALIIAAIMLVYCGLSYWLILVRSQYHLIFNTSLAHCDGFIVAIAIAEIGYTLWPTLLLLILFHVNALSLGSILRWFKAMIGGIAGLALAYFVLGHQSINDTNNQALNIAIFVIDFVYLCLCAIHSYRFQCTLMHGNQKLEVDKEAFRNHAYKLARYLPAPLSAKLEGQTGDVATHRKRITVFFSDILMLMVVIFIEFSQSYR